MLNLWQKYGVVLVDKNERKKILRELKEKKKAEFEKSLPISRDLFDKLFDFLDAQVEENGCSHNSDMATSFLNQNNIPVEPVLNWLKEHGGYCDCEILGNVQDTFEWGYN